MKKVKVLSLFDGCATGYTALVEAGFDVVEYHAYETDKHAIQIAKKNHPDIIHRGEIHFMTDFTEFEGFDFLIGGSPCQGFSMAGKQLNFKDPRSQLFFEFVRAMREAKPKYFLLENVKMKKEFTDEISRLMGVEPVLINSALLSAQNRVRNYWCNWKVEQPEDKKILLKDIIEYGVVDRDKSYCIDANYWKGTNVEQYINKGRRQVAFTERRTEEAKRIRKEFMKKFGRDFCPRRGKELVVREDGKMNCLTATYSLKEHTLIDEKLYYRKLTPVECERLQTLPDNYTEGVSNTQRYRMLGNGWTKDVIVHIFKQLQTNNL
jgi:site-specific DNA-cytosine methylase